MSLGTKIYTLLFGNLVATDEFGNKYYCNSKNFEDNLSRRWVIFEGEVEATKIPPHWHAWLHKSIDKPPLNYDHKYKWQKNHEKNLTGTANAYLPASHPLSTSNNNNYKKKEYDKWQP